MGWSEQDSRDLARTLCKYGNLQNDDKTQTFGNVRNWDAVLYIFQKILDHPNTHIDRMQSKWGRENGGGRDGRKTFLALLGKAATNNAASNREKLLKEIDPFPTAAIRENQGVVDTDDRFHCFICTDKHDGELVGEVDNKLSAIQEHFQSYHPTIHVDDDLREHCRSEGNKLRQRHEEGKKRRKAEAVAQTAGSTRQATHQGQDSQGQASSEEQVNDILSAISQFSHITTPQSEKYYKTRSPIQRDAIVKSICHQMSAYVSAYFGDHGNVAANALTKFDECIKSFSGSIPHPVQHWYQPVPEGQRVDLFGAEMNSGGSNQNVGSQAMEMEDEDRMQIYAAAGRE
ncbi:hypothetical protein GGR57DRAFT_312909 [Xylariaceae sp. FL1272]|nr:hypothetical protein GGR57DRAFT_312909 [Xylariaceae sp. FL1272]